MYKRDLMSVFNVYTKLETVSVVMSGVVSLTMGNSCLIIGNGIPCHTQLLCQLLLRMSLFRPRLFNVLSDSIHMPRPFPVLVALSYLIR